MAAADQPIFFCSQNANVQAQSAFWNKRSLGWAFESAMPGLDSSVALAAFAQAFDQWADVCGLTFHQATPADCDVLVTFGRIDGPLGVLAWSELPPGDDRRLTQKYDTGDSFVLAAAPARGKIDLLAVACHEIGHALGLDHAKTGTGDLMEPVYQPGRRAPQAGDVARILALYGPPVPRATTTAPPPPSGPRPVRIVIDRADSVELVVTGAEKISVPGYRVTPENG